MFTCGRRVCSNEADRSMDGRGGCMTAAIVLRVSAIASQSCQRLSIAMAIVLMEIKTHIIQYPQDSYDAFL